MDWRCQMSAFILAVVMFVVVAFCYAAGSIYAFRDENITRSFNDAKAAFGPDVESHGRRGVLYKGEPVDGCGAIKPPRSFDENLTVSAFVLLQQGNCDFARKVFNAQQAGYLAAIIYNVNSNELIPMVSELPEVENKICIPSVFIGQDTANILTDLYLHYKPGNPHVELIPKQLDSLWYSLLFVGLCFLSLLCLLCIRCIIDYMHDWLSLRRLKKLPVKKFEKDDEYDVCAICLDDYDEGDVLRILPCQHAYHCKCVDRWLTTRKCICPLCKRSVVGDDKSSISLVNVGESTVDENTSLLMPTSEAASTNAPRYGIGYSVRTPFTNYWCFYGQRRASTLFSATTSIEASGVEAAQETPGTSAQAALRFSAGMNQYQSQELTLPHSDVTTECHTVNETIITARSPGNLESQLDLNQEDIIAI